MTAALKTTAAELREGCKERKRPSGGGGKDLSNPPPRSHVQVNVDVTFTSPEKKKQKKSGGMSVLQLPWQRGVSCVCRTNSGTCSEQGGACVCVSQITANSQITGIMEDGCEGSIHLNNNNNNAHTATVQTAASPDNICRRSRTQDNDPKRQGDRKGSN